MGEEATCTTYMAATHPQLLLHFYRHDVDSSFVYIVSVE